MNLYLTVALIALVAGAIGGIVSAFVVHYVRVRMASVEERVSLGGERPRWMRSPRKVQVVSRSRQHTAPPASTPAADAPVSEGTARLRDVRIRHRQRPQSD